MSSEREGRYGTYYNPSWDFIIDKFRETYPRIYEQMVDWYPSGQLEITIRTEDGTKYAFHEIGARLRVVRSLIEPLGEIDDEVWKQNFARKLIRRMHNFQVSQEWLSEKTGISQRMISQYANGRSAPSGPNIERIARALACSTSELTSID